MSEQILYASDVNIKTAAIEVKVMKIGNRQVTLAVFRQLPEEDIIDPVTGELRGMPWGRVNYHVDCEGQSTHLHVVWQRGNELRRGVEIPNPFAYAPWHQMRNDLDMILEAYIAARILEGWKPDGLALPQRYSFELAGEIMKVHLVREVSRAWSLHFDGTERVHSQDLERIIRDAKVPMQSQAIANDYILPLRETLNAHQRQWQQSYSQIEQLDQLFIAV